MKTAVLQSYRTHDVAPWLETCLTSVRNWTSQNGFEYRFCDDRFFGYCSQDLRTKLEGSKLPITDIARLEWAAEVLGEGLDRVIWIDADVLVFDPERLIVPEGRGFQFCKEVWLTFQSGQRQLVRGLNNCVCAFEAGDPFLDFYRSTCRTLVQTFTEPPNPSALGTIFLRNLSQAMPIPQLTCVGLFSPKVLKSVARGAGPDLEAYMGAFKSPLAAANLGASSSGTGRVTEDDFPKAVDALLETQGFVVNRFSRD